MTSLGYSQPAEEYFNRGNAKSDQNNYKGAIVDYTNAIEINPKNAFFYYKRGFAEYCLQNYNDAIADHSKSIELDPTDRKSVV